jgi:uncharacterized membrane protein HdeD (DUF308 family)
MIHRGKKILDSSPNRFDNSNVNNINSDDHTKPAKPASGQLAIGILFITLGAILLFGHLLGGWFIAKFWPFFLIAGGAVFYIAYFFRHEKPAGYEGMLFPGTYLIILGLLFFINNLVGWQAMRYLWPTFVLGVAISLYAMYRCCPKDEVNQNKDLLSAIRILSIISGALYLLTIGGWRLWPLVLIVIGVLIIYRGIDKKKKHTISEG